MSSDLDEIEGRIVASEAVQISNGKAEEDLQICVEELRWKESAELHVNAHLALAWNLAPVLMGPWVREGAENWVRRSVEGQVTAYVLCCGARTGGDPIVWTFHAVVDSRRPSAENPKKQPICLRRDDFQTADAVRVWIDRQLSQKHGFQLVGGRFRAEANKDVNHG